MPRTKQTTSTIFLKKKKDENDVGKMMKKEKITVNNATEFHSELLPSTVFHVFVFGLGFRFSSNQVKNY